MPAEFNLYVGTVGQGVWRSSDGGASFERASRGMFVECDVRALAVHPHNPRRLYAGTNEGCYRSDDGGDNWSPLSGPWQGRVIWSLLVLPGEPATLFAGTRPAALFRSDDEGESWSAVDVPMAQECPGILYNRVTTIMADPDDAEVIWAGVEIDGAWRGEDQGRRWTRLAEGLSSLDIHGLAIAPASGNEPRRLLASTNNDLNVSSDEGRTWQPQHVERKFPWPYCRGLAQSPVDPAVMYLGNGDGPPGCQGAGWRSTNGGRDWQRLELPTAPNSTIWDFAVHPADPRRVFAYSISGQVFHSTNGGENWSLLPRQFGEIRSLLWTPVV